jgi:hypothetical protein
MVRKKCRSFPVGDKSINNNEEATTMNIWQKLFGAQSKSTPNTDDMSPKVVNFKAACCTVIQGLAGSPSQARDFVNGYFSQLKQTNLGDYDRVIVLLPSECPFCGRV